MSTYLFRGTQLNRKFCECPSTAMSAKGQFQTWEIRLEILVNKRMRGISHRQEKENIYREFILSSGMGDDEPKHEYVTF